ncbi:MAG: glutamine--fructose-6-phosphate transaminase (isomerizing) [Trueperaceae bacterium]|nr:glutamine--fructose-6-phosphate transaminase (isomerizing) [Trueperaceae bacterium]
MCGIVGYVGARDASPIVLDGLSRLEYRGYDSAGIVSLDADGAMAHVKRAGKLRVLADAMQHAPLPGHLALGHTRWATHGRPSDVNAHPHLSEDGRLAIIHNGIIENYAPLRARLQDAGHAFASETDSEVLVHLIEHHYRGDLAAAVRAALREVEGAFALVCAHAGHDEIVAARATSPLVVGLGDGETFLASDVPALLPYTRRVVYLADGDVAIVRASGLELQDVDGAPRPVREDRVDWDAEAAEKGGYPHFMLKEIFEQPTVLQNTFGGRFDPSGSDVNLDLSLDPAAVDRVVITACGTASYAGQVGRALIERWARLPVQVEVASEFRYQRPVLDARTLVVAVSQSGETIDTLGAVRRAREAGARTLAVLNVKGSSLAREVDDVLYVHAGPEIGVASTKAYLAMIAAFALLALRLGRARGTLGEDEARALIEELRRMPGLAQETLERRDAVDAVAAGLTGARDALFLGRGVHVATAFEGALKLKEISYLHAEAYPTGEMKHGPIALIDEHMPVIVIATAGDTYAKTVSNMQEVRARDGRLIAIASDGDDDIAQQADQVLYVPRTSELLSALLVAIPLQLLAYQVAVRLGRDVDQPRNLAKSVTVE